MIVLAVGVAIAALVVLVGPRFISLTGAINIAVVAGGPLLALGVILFSASTKVFRSEVVCISYDGPAARQIGADAARLPTTLAVHVSTGAIRSKVVTGRRMQGRVVARVIGPGGASLISLPNVIARQIPPGRDFPPLPPDQEDDGMG